MSLSLLFQILAIFFLLLVSFFALLAPLFALTNNGAFVQRYTMPLSLSVEIIFGYVFYVFGQATEFPGVYLVVMLVLNAWAIGVVRKRGFVMPREGLLSIARYFAIYLVIGVALVFSYFYYAYTKLAPGIPDTYSHIYFLGNIKQVGYISQTFYAPGFHLFMLPVSMLLPDSVVYRFAGPVFGLFVALSMFLALRDQVKNRVVGYILLVLFCVPVFNPMILEYIGFWPSSISFVLLTSILAIIIWENGLSVKASLVVYSIVVLALSLSVPYVYVQLLPILILFVLATFLMKRPTAVKRRLLLLFVVTALGVVVAFAHVYVLTQIIHKSGAFPQPVSSLAYNVKQVVDQGVNQVSGVSGRISGPTVSTGLLSSIVKSRFYTSNITPLMNIGRDMVQPKGLVPIWTTSSAKSYGWILVSLICALYFAIKKEWTGFSIFFFTVAYGLINVTGIIELADYRGRSGWYFMLLALFGLVFLLDRFYIKQLKYLYWLLLLGFIVWSLSSRPVYQQYECVDIYPEVASIVADNPGKQVVIFTNNGQISLLSNQIEVQKINVDALDLLENHPTYIVFEKQYCDALPAGLKESLANDADFKKAEVDNIDIHNKQQANIALVKQSPKFGSFALYWQDGNYSIYRRGVK